MKKYITLAIILFSCLSCSAATYLGVKIPIQGETLSDTRVQNSVVSYVYAKVARANKGCRELNLASTKVVEKPTNVAYNKYGKQISGNWQEEWTVNACGQPVIVPVDFQVTRAGTRYIVNDIKQAAEEK